MRLQWGKTLITIAAAAGLALGAAGCVSPRSSAAHRLSPYRVDDRGRRPWDWQRRLDAATPAAVPETPAGTATADPASVVDLLRRGDIVTITLRGIPDPEEIQDVVDERGCITLRYLGDVEVAGLTTSEVEDIVEKGYVESGYYVTIDVIVRKQLGEYFIQGEVNAPGRYNISGDLSLLQAIAAAKGYTDFASRRRVRIIRGDRETRLNPERIREGKDDDPLIQANDIIYVEKKIL